MSNRFDQLADKRRGCALLLSALAASLFWPATAKAASFVPTGSLNQARDYHTATLLHNGKVLVTGGVGTNMLASAELYDLGSGTWTLTGPWGTARDYHTATILPNGKVLVVGGATYVNGVGSRSVAEAELYDPTTGGWTVTGSMNTAREGHTATLLPNGKVLVAGGETFAGGEHSIASAELYDPASGTWARGGTNNEARAWHTATLLPNGKVLVAGGLDANAFPAQRESAELYDPDTGTWALTGSLSDRRSNHAATLLPNGKVLVAGGGEWGFFASIVIPLSSAELYDATTGTWTPTGESNVERWQPTVTLLPNGHVLLIGGKEWTSIPYSSAEEYDPVSGNWSFTANMTTNRILHTATLLPNGQVLVAGGRSISTLSSAELYGEPREVTRPRLTGPTILPNGSFRFSFTNTPGALFSVLATTSPALPASSWTLLSGLTEMPPGRFQFTDTEATNYTSRFYGLRQP